MHFVAVPASVPRYLCSMTVETFGPLRVHVRGGVDHRGGGDGPAILLCHGFGAPGDDLVDLSRMADVGRNVRWFFPEAPQEVYVGSGVWGRAWWPIDMESLIESLMRGDIDAAMRRLDEVPEGMEAARDALAKTLEVLERQRGVRRDKLVIGGFSQGSMVTTELATWLGEPFAGLVLLSGTRIAEERWRPGFEALGERLHALMTHGRRDPILPFGRAEVLRDMMRESGATVTWVPHGGGHEIPRMALDAFTQFAKERLS